MTTNPERKRSLQDRRRKASEIFANALETPPDARTEFLNQACSNDPKLRQEVEALLRASPEARAWFEKALRTREEAPTAERPAAHAGRPSDLAEADAETTVTQRPLAAVGTIVGHYKLEGLLGAGGMGEVYRAHDLALGRAAAIKVLRPGVDASLRKRLLKEAETCIRLAHPAIAAFFESGTTESIDYLALEFIEGETLRRRLHRGPLTLDEALSLTSTLLEALVHAHAAGILHRDIKPENIMLTGRGMPKLLDFGIAKEIGIDEAEVAEALTATVTALTGHGVIVGTLGYMSPEQLRGENINANTDVFALGAVLYEALACERAFPGTTASEKIAATLSRDPPPIRRDDVPPDIHAILQRALARDPEVRYPSARAFLSDLRRLATGEALAVLPNTLAILDFENLSGDESDDWLGSGIAESLGVDLQRAEGLSIVPRGKVLKVRAALSAQQSPADAVALGLSVGCRWVVTGSFQKMGRALRLTTRLVEVSTGNDVWTEKLDGSMDDVFSMQDRLARLTVESLHVVLPERETKNTSKQLTAYEYYVRGKQLWHVMSRSSLDQAREHLERAIEVDPNHAPALAWLAAIYSPGRWIETTDPKLLDTAIHYATRAIEADPNLGDAHLWLGYSVWRQNRRQHAFEILEKATKVEPSNPLPFYFAGCVLFDMGRFQEGLAKVQRAAELGPKTPFILAALGYGHAELGRFLEARWAFTKTWELEQEAGAGGWVSGGAALADCMRREGALDEARAQCMRALERVEQSDHPLRDSQYGGCLCVVGRTALEQGDRDAARVAFEQSLAHLRARPRASGTGHFVVQALAGQARTTEDPVPYEEALHLFDARETYDFSFGGLAADYISLNELARAAHAVGRAEEARTLRERAIAAGSWEARQRNFDWGVGS